MRRINQQNNNTPEAYDQRFPKSFGLYDIERLTMLAKHFKGGVYVDVGCFDSVMPLILAERYPKSKIYAMDHSPGLINFLHVRFPQVNYIVGEAMKLPFEDESVDQIVAGELIEHLDDPKAFIDECLRVLKKGGWVSISTPFEERGSEIGGPMHVWAFTVDDIKEIMAPNEVIVLQEETNKTIVAWRKK